MFVDGFVDMMSVTFNKMSERCIHCIWRYMYFCNDTIYGAVNARSSRVFASSTCLKHASAKQSIIRETNTNCNNVCETRFIHTRRRNCSIYLTNFFCSSSKQWLGRWRLQDLHHGKSRQRPQIPLLCVLIPQFWQCWTVVQFRPSLPVNQNKVKLY